MMCMFTDKSRNESAVVNSGSVDLLCPVAFASSGRPVTKSIAEDLFNLESF